jgi:hypothetical protein
VMIIKKKVINLLYNLQIKITDIKNVHVINNKKINNYYSKYLIFKICYNITKIIKSLRNYIMKYKEKMPLYVYYLFCSIINPICILFEKIKEQFNYNVSKICIEKKTRFDSRFIILNKKNNNFNNIAQHIDFMQYNDNVNIKNQFMKFEIIIPDKKTNRNNKINVKNLLIPYQDTNNYCDNTLQNIFEFKQIDISDNNIKNIKVNIIIFNKIPIKKTIPYELIKNINISNIYKQLYSSLLLLE